MKRALALMALLAASSLAAAVELAYDSAFADYKPFAEPEVKLKGRDSKRAGKPQEAPAKDSHEHHGHHN